MSYLDKFLDNFRCAYLDKIKVSGISNQVSIDDFQMKSSEIVFWTVDRRILATKFTVLCMWSTFLIYLKYYWIEHNCILNWAKIQENKGMRDKLTTKLLVELFLFKIYI